MVAKIEPVVSDDRIDQINNPASSSSGSSSCVEQVPEATDCRSEVTMRAQEQVEKSSVVASSITPTTTSASTTAMNDKNNENDETTQQHDLNDKEKLSPERSGSPFWSSEEESSKPDGASSASDDTEEFEAKIAARGNRDEFRAAPRVNPPLGGDITADDDDDSMTIDYEQADRFGDLPEIFFPQREKENMRMSMADIEICQRLDLEYERALEEREIGYNARYQSVRQSAALSILFMFFYLAAGTAFFTQEAGWEFHDALFFSIYTMTTVGYGFSMRDNIPNHGTFQVFVVFYIFVGIATLTIMVAQVYQCVALEANRAQHARDRAEITRKGQDVISRRSQVGMNRVGEMTMIHEMYPTTQERCLDYWIRLYERTKLFVRDSEIGRGLSVLFPFAGLIIIGAAVVGPIEGWTAIESIYFSCVSLTTVGYGAYVPKNKIAIYFCIFWLPFSVGFMSLYLSNVASFYIRLSDRNIHRLETQMRRRIKRAKEQAIKRSLQSGSATSAQLGTDDPLQGSKTKKRKPGSAKGFEMVSDEDDAHALFGTDEADTRMRRNQILIDSNYSLNEDEERPDGQTMQTMKDILRTVRYNLTVNIMEDRNGHISSDESSCSLRSQESEFMSIRSSQKIISPSVRRGKSVQHKPTFALRVLVQERFAEIIATDIAGFQSHIEIKENTLSVTIDTLKETADKWLVPRRARKAFRAVAFEALYFVGEHGLITRGADALYDLSPFEFHGLFSPLLAAMGDAETMEGWLATTDVLADVDLRRDGTRPGLNSIITNKDVDRRDGTRSGSSSITKADSDLRQDGTRSGLSSKADQLSDTIETTEGSAELHKTSMGGQFS